MASDNSSVPRGRPTKKTKTGAKKKTGNIAKPPSRNEISSLKKKIRLHKADAAAARAELKSCLEDYEIVSAILRGIFDLSYLHDLECNFILANEAALRLLGYNESEVTSVNFARLLDEEGLNKAMTNLKGLIEKGYQERAASYRLRTASGRHVWVEVVASLVRRDGKPYAVQGLGRDITERVLEEKIIQAERDVSIALNECEDLNQGLSRVMEIVTALPGIDGGGIYVIDNESGAIDLIAHRGLSDRFIAHFSHYDSETPQAGIVREGKLYNLTKSDRRIAGNPLYQNEGLTSLCSIPVIHRGVPVAALNVASKSFDAIPSYLVNGFIVIAYEIALSIIRHRAEDALQKSERLFRALIDHSYDAVTMIAADGTILYDSPSVSRVLGHTPEDRVGMNIIDFAVPEDREDIRMKLPLFTPMEGAVVPYEGRFIDGKGASRWIEGVLTNLLHDPNVGAIVFNYRDITARKEADERLKRSLHEKEILLQEIHHRVKNNLQTTVSLLNLYGERIRDPKANAAIRDISAKIYSMAQIHEILYSREDLSRIDMKVYVRNLTDWLFNAYSIDERRIHLTLDLGEVSFDLKRAMPCGLLIQEILSNVLKHAFPDGREGNICISMKKARDGFIELVIADNGIGLPDDVDEKEGGSLGMTLVRGWVRQLRADLVINRSAGTRYVIRIPHSEAESGC